jgi:hypothetical protein
MTQLELPAQSVLQVVNLKLAAGTDRGCPEAARSMPGPSVA